MSSYNEYKKRLLEIATSDGPMPSRKSDSRLYWALRDLTTETRPRYDSHLRSVLAQLRPEWFWSPTRRLNEQLLELARCGAARPETGHPLRRVFLSRTQSGPGSDPELAAELRRLAPHWFDLRSRQKAARQQEIIRRQSERRSQRAAQQAERRAQEAAREARHEARRLATKQRAALREMERSASRQARQAIREARAAARLASRSTAPKLSPHQIALIELARSGAPPPRRLEARALYDCWQRVRSGKARQSQPCRTAIQEIRPDWFSKRAPKPPRSKPAGEPRTPRAPKPPRSKPAREPRTPKPRIQKSPSGHPAPKPASSAKSGIPDRFPVLPPAVLPPPDTRHAEMMAEIGRYAGTGRGLLLDLARTGQPPPKNGPLAELWRRCRDPQSWDYDQAFLDLLKEIRPGWGR